MDAGIGLRTGTVNSLLRQRLGVVGAAEGNRRTGQRDREALQDTDSSGGRHRPGIVRLRAEQVDHNQFLVGQQACQGSQRRSNWGAVQFVARNQRVSRLAVDGLQGYLGLAHGVRHLPGQFSLLHQHTPARCRQLQQNTRFLAAKAFFEGDQIVKPFATNSPRSAQAFQQRWILKIPDTRNTRVGLPQIPAVARGQHMNLDLRVQQAGSSQKGRIDDCVAQLAIMRKNENFQKSTLPVLIGPECTRATAKRTTPHR